MSDDNFEEDGELPEKSNLCKHSRFKYDVKTANLSSKTLEIRQMVLLIKLNCSNCSKNFIFDISKFGFSTNEATISNDATEIRIPFSYPWTFSDEEFKQDEEDKKNIIH